MDYQSFLNDIQLPLDGQRLEISTILFNAIKDENSNDNNNNSNNNDTQSISKTKLIDSFNSNNHPLVTSGQFSGAQIQDMLLNAWTNSEGI